MPGKVSKWTDEALRAEALKYPTIKEFRNSQGGAYMAAHRKGPEFFQKVCSHMKRADSKSRWWVDTLRKEALKYQSRVGFIKGSYGAYQAAQKFGREFFEEICSHMGEPVNKPWTKEELRAEAHKYQRRVDFQRGSPGAENTARKVGEAFFNDICSHMEILRIDWTKELCRADALKYETRALWRAASERAYGAAHKNGWLDDVCAHFELAYSPLTKEECAAEALKYRTRGDFIKGSPKAYKYAAHHKGWLDELCGHMATSRNSKDYSRLRKDECRTEALKYDSRGRFRVESPKDFSYACKKGWLDELCGHMTGGQTKWTKEMCRSIAGKHPTRSSFQKASHGAYAYALRRGWIDEICPPSLNKPGWDKDECRAEALKYDTRTAFCGGSGGAYYAAIRKGWDAEVCFHMNRGRHGFKHDRSGFLYDRECNGPGFRNPTSKVGITNLDPLRRAYEFRCKPEYTATLRTLISFEDGRLCANVESYINRTYKDFKFEVGFDGPRFMRNGMAEVFSRDVFRIWLASDHGRAILATPGVTVVMLDGAYQSASDIGIEEVHGRALLREIAATFEFA